MTVNKFEQNLMSLIADALRAGIHPAMLISVFEVHKSNLVDMIRHPQEQPTLIVPRPEPPTIQPQ